MKSLSEKVIVIMGASSGIGEATARLLARKGAKLVIAARRQERLIAIKKELPEATILVQQADVTKEEEVQRVIKLTMENMDELMFFLTMQELCQRRLLLKHQKENGVKC